MPTHVRPSRRGTKLEDLFEASPALVLGSIESTYNLNHYAPTMRGLLGMNSRAEPAEVKKLVSIFERAGSVVKDSGGYRPGPAWTAGGAQDEVDRLIADGW